MINLYLSEIEIINIYNRLIEKIIKNIYDDNHLYITILDRNDLEQETRIALLKAIRKGIHLNYNYVKKIIYGTSIDKMKHEFRRTKNKVRFFPLETRYEEKEYYPFDDIDRIIIIKKISRLIWARKRFTDKQKIAFNLRFIDKWTYEMISDYLKISQSCLSEWFDKMIKDVLIIMKIPNKRIA